MREQFIYYHMEQHFQQHFQQKRLNNSKRNPTFSGHYPTMPLSNAPISSFETRYETVYGHGGVAPSHRQPSGNPDYREEGYPPPPLQSQTSSSPRFNPTKNQRVTPPPPMMEAPSPVYTVYKPHAHDVLCGRGVPTNKHKGNEAFRVLVHSYKDQYKKSRRGEKWSIAASIVEKIHALEPPGRFLEQDLKTKRWCPISQNKAAEKASQALRDACKQRRQRRGSESNLELLARAAF